MSVGHPLHRAAHSGRLQMPPLLVLLWATGGLPLVILQMTRAGTQSHAPRPSLCTVGGPAALLWLQGTLPRACGQMLWSSRGGAGSGWGNGEEARVGGARVCAAGPSGPPGHRPDHRPPREPVPYHLCPVQEVQELLMPVVMK